MKKYVIFIVTAVICLVLCLPVSVLAAGELTPVRATIRGVIYESGGSAAFYEFPVYYVSANEFCVVPNETLTGAGYLRFYFNIDTDSWSSFRVNFTFLDTRISVSSTDGTFSSNVFLYNYSNGTLSGYQDVSSYSRNVKTISDGLASFDFQILNSEGFNRNTIMVTCPLSAAVIGSGSYYNFRVNYMYVDGVPVEDLAVTETNVIFEDTISELSQNEERMWAQVIAPDLTDTFDRIQQQNNSTYSDYKSVIAAVSVDNFLIPGLLMIVFSFAFYSYVVFGRKG